MDSVAARNTAKTYRTVLAAIRAGNFSGVLADKAAMSVLKSEAEKEDIDSVSCLQASVMLAEVFDQIGAYADAERYLSFDPAASRALRRLTVLSRSSPRPDPDLESSSRETRLDLRALAFFCLQQAIALHRHSEDASKTLDGAILLANSAEKCLRSAADLGYRFHGAQSMFAYWIGRFTLLKRRWKEARSSFQLSIRHEHDNLRFHLQRHAKGLHQDQVDAEGSCSVCMGKIAYTNYLLASNMAFGLATVEMEEGSVENALTLLRPAMIMLEGSTLDPYRKGYVRLLIGRAERVRAGASAAGLDRAIDSLREAEFLFTAASAGKAEHSIYAARTYHQHCIACMFKSRDRNSSQPEKEEALIEAVRHIISATRYYSQNARLADSAQYMDHRLEIRLVLTRIRLLGELLKACVSERGRTVREALQDWGVRVPHLAEFSRIWHSVSKDVSPSSSDQEVLSMLAAELLETLSAAGRLDRELSSDQSSRSYVLLAESEAVSAVVRYAVAYASRQISPEEASRLRETRLPRTNRPNISMLRETWRDVALESAVKRLRELLARSRTIKVRAAAQVSLANLLLLQGGNATVTARESLRKGWEPIKSQVENQILHDAVDELTAELPPSDRVCVIAMEVDNHVQTWDQMKDSLQRQVVTALLRDGIPKEEIVTRLGLTLGTLRNWHI